MQRPAVFVLGILVIAGAGFFFSKFRIEGIDHVRVLPRDPNAPVGAEETRPPVKRAGETIRIASFHIQTFGPDKAKDPQVMERLARIVRQFDVVAVQGICSKDPSFIPRFVELINTAGRDYDWVIGEPAGSGATREQCAFLFDKASLETDRNKAYMAEDPLDRLSYEPHVATFRVRGPTEEEAFTFTLVNVRVDPDRSAGERAALDEVLQAVRGFDKDEDDVILLGDFNADSQNLGDLAQVPGILWAISNLPTNTAGTRSTDNLIFDRQKTTEYRGRSGTFDFMRDDNMNMKLEDAKRISHHLPVWAEFSIYEGGQAGRVAESGE